MNQENVCAGKPNENEINELKKELAEDRQIRDEASEIVREEDKNIERIEKKVEELEHSVIELFVNGERKEWRKREISHREVVVLFYDNYEESDTIGYSVDYTHGPEGHREGILNPGQTVPVINKMRFRVQKANRS